MGNVKWFWGYLKGHTLRLVLSLSIGFLGSVTASVNPIMTGMVIDNGFGPGTRERMYLLIGVWLSLAVIRGIMHYFSQWSFEKISQNIAFSIRRDLYISLQQQDFDFYDKTRTGDIMARMTSDVEAIRHMVVGIIQGGFDNAVIFISAIAVMMFINPVLALCTMVVMPFVVIFVMRVKTRVRPAYLRVRAALSSLNSDVQENVSGNRVVRAFAKEDWEIKKFRERNEAFKDENLKVVQIWQKYLPLIETFGSSFSVIVLAVGGYMTIKGHMTLGELVTFNSLAWAVNNPLRVSGWIISEFQRARASMAKVRELMDRRPSIYTKKEYVERGRIKGEVWFKDVSFSYAAAPVLKNISFKAEPGQSVALLGATGSGKSTLANLISRFYDATEGEVLIDGVNIKELNLRKLRQNISVAMQDVFLFSDTIEGNIAYGVPDAPFERVREVASASAADDFISSLPQGYETIVGERGVGLSGGQKQRIALARALIKNPAILILDDTTSAVDFETEHYIQAALRRFSKERTTFIIAHRISSIKDTDLILVLENGSIKERGTHDELLKMGGLYYSVYENQYGDFNKEMSKVVKTDGSQ